MAPVLAAYPDFIRAVRSASKPQRNDVLSVVALRAPDGVRVASPVRGVERDRAADQLVKTVTEDVGAMAEEIGRRLPAARIGKIGRRNFAQVSALSLFLYVYDAAGALSALAIARL